MFLQLRPLESVLRTLLEAIKAKDVNDVFGQPVNIKEVPDYLEIVSQPMDLSTMEVINSESFWILVYIKYISFVILC